MRNTALSRRSLIAFAAATVVSSLLAPAASAAGTECTWQVEVLPVQEGMGSGNLRITGVDGQGNVSGFYAPNRTDHTLVRWTAAGLEVVPRPEGAGKFVTIAGNASGVVVGTVDRPGTSSVLMTHAPGVGYRELPTPAGYDNVAAKDINGRGDVLGRAYTPTTFKRVAVLWRADGSAPEVIAPAEVRSPDPVAIADDGTVLLDSSETPYLWRSGVLTALPDWGYTVYPRGLTRDGVITSRLYDSPRTSWKWHEATGVNEQFSVAGVIDAVNEDGLAVGYLPDGNYTGAVWQGTKFLTALPLPTGAFNGQAGAVGEGGALGGFAGGKAVRWTCH
ncbi:hypothetical protein ABZ816_38235 [Actinosynnema sp. NPDC047251]|uniref:Putative secreted protein n=1 Tax=Saccharothrix espanaensis (strain ATCC 51144 / DSM 44229 / JCM 9112 / NBRC 15066 / NRRL 15764) TaxID=1179773 RepID=K0JRD6_SACES|nr:hypothetical protein [Saccharothrix espanaensis]CCH30160.1 putative secreted protein [Saccharothrix espanaensis DSM 44229]